MSLPQLREQRATKIAEMRTLTDTAQGEKRDLSENEAARFDALEGETRAIDTQIGRTEKLDALERAAANVNDGPKDQPELRSYSIAKALRQGTDGRLDGIEAEWHQHLAEQRGEARGTMIPTQLIMGGEQRANLLTTPAANPGSNIVKTDLTSMTDRRRPVLRMEQIGTSILRGLSGDVEMPRMISGATAHWVGEHQDTTQSEAGFEKKKISPKTVSGEMELSRRFLIQSNEAIDSILTRDLALTLATALDLAAINGAGGDEPLGMLNDPLLQEVPSAGNDIGEDTSLLMQALEIDDVFDEAAFLTHPRIAHEARVSRDTTGQPLPTGWFWHGRPFALTTQVPETAANERPIFYGAFSNAYLAFWSGIDILQNPYDSRVSSKGGLLIQAFLDSDFLIRHPEAIRVVKRAI